MDFYRKKTDTIQLDECERLGAEGETEKRLFQREYTDKGMMKLLAFISDRVQKFRLKYYLH